jgi:hypothetical protein
MATQGKVRPDAGAPRGTKSREYSRHSCFWTVKYCALYSKVVRYRYQQYKVVMIKYGDLVVSSLKGSLTAAVR